MICSICQCQVCIPVSLICFPCYSFNKFHCHSVNRVCYECVIRYCELNCNQNERSESLKCLFCPETCNLQKLNFSNTFQFDFLLHNQLYPNKTECPFCFQFVSNIFHHLEKCNDSYIQCSCGYISLRQIYRYHFHDCPHYKKCNYCEEYIPKEDWINHLYEYHEMFECSECKEIVKENNKLIHKYYLCPYRIISCRMCNEQVCLHDLQEHFQKHKDEIKKSITDIKDFLIKLYEKYNEILQEEQKYFKRYCLTE